MDDDKCNLCSAIIAQRTGTEAGRVLSESVWYIITRIEGAWMPWTWSISAHTFPLNLRLGSSSLFDLFTLTILWNAAVKASIPTHSQNVIHVCGMPQGPGSTMMFHLLVWWWLGERVLDRVVAPEKIHVVHASVHTGTLEQVHFVMT
jgi:hypothetical protein